MEVTSDLEQNILISKFTTYILENMYRCWWLVSSDYFAYPVLETFSIQLSLREI